MYDYNLNGGNKMKKILSILLAVIITVTSCVCGLTVFAAPSPYDCGNHDLKSTTYTYTSDPSAPENGVTYEKQYECYNENCFPEPILGSAGSTDRCPKCHERTLRSRTIYYATCVEKGRTVYVCGGECGTFVADETNTKDHKFVPQVIAPTCTEQGYTLYTCNCVKYGATENATKIDSYIPAKGHSMNKAGSTYVYTYANGECKIEGQCADCNNILEGENAVVKKYTPAEKCYKCGSDISSKTIEIPANCDDGAKITVVCPNASCNTGTITSLPVGHEAKTTTYNYSNGTYIGAEVDCYKCGVHEIVDDTYANDTKCAMCSGNITSRVVVAPTCQKNGYTQVNCPDCGGYNSDAKPAHIHDAGVSEWTFDREAGKFNFKSTCRSYGCDGYQYDAVIGILGKCDRCNKDTLIYKKTTYSECTSKSYTVIQCSNCCEKVYENGELVYKPYEFVKSNARAHDKVTSNKEATCTEEGYTISTCKDCYYTVKSDIVPAYGHIGGVTMTEYKTNGDKISTGICEICNEDYTKEGTYSNADIKCDKCGQYSVTKKVVVKPNCSTEALKGTSGYTMVYCPCMGSELYYIPDSSIIPAAHNYGSWQIVKIATCSEAGLRTRTCSLCGDVHEEEIPVNETESGDPKHIFVVIEKGYAATCEKEGLTDCRYCSQCGIFENSVVIPATGHKTDPGSLQNKNFCSRCNSYIVDELGEGMVKVPVLDADGKPVYEVDKDGNLVPVYKQVACSCMHHNVDGLAQFFFKIILFFCQLLGINKVCDCGVAHY